MSQQDVYVARMKLQIDELNLELKTLESKAKEARRDVKLQYDEQMEKVRLQSRLASAKLDELSSAAEGSWDRMVADMEKLRNAFTSSFHYCPVK
jgi:uncharacterized membrane protein